MMIQDINKVDFATIKRPSVVEEIIDVFKRKLILGELKPGDKLPSETQLIHQLGVGRTALREAIKMLSAYGVIDVKQGNGSYVSSSASTTTMNPLVFAILLQSGLTIDLFELRALLEVGYCQLAAEKATPEDILEIKKAAEKFEKFAILKNRDIEELTNADLGFHYTIITATHNRLVAQISHAVEELFFSSIRNTISKIEGREWGVSGHRRIISAIISKDTNEIHRSVVSSLERWKNDLENLV